jgi:hypothetical protein
LEPRKVTAMKRHPIRDKHDPTRSMVLNAFSCVAVISAAFILAISSGREKIAQKGGFRWFLKEKRK